MINIIFFSKYRESFGASTLTVSLGSLTTIKDLVAHLEHEYPDSAVVFADPQLLVAINQQLANMTSNVRNGDEVAFFPPVSGG